MVKEPLAELKFAIFKNWLDTRPKMETHEPNVYPTILGGVSRTRFLEFLLRFGRSKYHFLTGTSWDTLVCNQDSDLLADSNFS